MLYIGIAKSVCIADLWFSIVFDLCLHRYTLELDLFRNNQIGFAVVRMAGICNVNRPLGRCNQPPLCLGTDQCIYINR